MRTKTLLIDRRGSTMVVALGLVLGITLLTMAGLGAATSNLKVANNYRTGFQALLAAEAGAVHAQEMIDQWGVIRFSSDVIPVWDSIYGNSSRTMPGASWIRYSSTVASDPDNPDGSMFLTTLGEAPGESQRSIVAKLAKDGVFSPGAIYLPADAVDPKFNGNAFLVDGHDTNLNGTRNPENDVPGITTRLNSSRDAVRAEISSGQLDNVIGLTSDPSVETTAGSTVERIREEIVPDILSRPGVVTNPHLNGNDVFGTNANPQITYFTGSLTINGTVDGAGILIVDQGLKLNGTMRFNGLIIVRGTTEITTVSGNATILGAIWTTDLKLTVAGSASVTYSTEALTLAGATGGGNTLPERVEVVAWREL